jgi:hypothetical protein
MKAKKVEQVDKGKVRNIFSFEWYVPGVFFGSMKILLLAGMPKHLRM